MRIRTSLVGLFVALLIQSLWCSPTQAAVFFDEGFESGQLLPNWSTGSCQYMNPGGSPWPNGCNPTVSTDIAHSGSHSLKKDYTTPLIPDGGGGTHGEWIDRSHPATSEVYYRWWQYGVNFVPDASRSKSFYIGLSAPNFLVTTAWGQGNLSMDSQQEVGGLSPCNGTYTSCWYAANAATVPINNGQWHCVEAHVKLNTVGLSDGVLELWTNGILTLRYGNRMFRDASGKSGITTNDLSSVRIFTQAGSGIEYYDDFAVGNARIGCSASPTSDLTPPVAPAGLKVQ